MNYARAELLAVLPIRLRQALQPENLDDLEEIRLRVKFPTELVRKRKSCWLEDRLNEEDLQFCINAASRYSPWTASTAALGYVTAPGGHRIGICGDMVYKDGCVSGVRKVSSLCIRVAKDYFGIAEPLAALRGSILILGAPGTGKTTLMRDLIRQRSNGGTHVAVADERGELFPGNHFPTGECTDIMSGCPKASAIEMLLRTMGPDSIAVDEITAQSDCESLIQANNCGVALLATAHGTSLEDLRRRAVYAPLVKNHIFDHIVLMHPDKSWHLERSK